MKKYIFTLLCITTLFSCTTLKNGSAFELLGSIGKKHLQKITQAKDSIFKKDTVNLSCVVPRDYCRQVLGNKVSRWLTAKGEATLNKKDLRLGLFWEVQSDTTKVRINYNRIKIPYANK